MSVVIYNREAASGTDLGDKTRRDNGGRILAGGDKSAVLIDAHVVWMVGTRPGTGRITDGVLPPLLTAHVFSYLSEVSLIIISAIAVAIGIIILSIGLICLRW